MASGTSRLVRAWRALPPERRLAAYASFGLFIALFLPWYQETVIATGKSNLQAATATLTGWGAFSFVEAAVLLVAVGVLTLLFQRAEGRAFHLPGGDGAMIFAAGIWTCLLIVWRIFDKQGTDSHGQFATTSGIEWGIFVALGVAAFLTYAGSRIRATHRPEPPLPGERSAAAAPAGGPSAGGPSAGGPSAGGLWAGAGTSAGSQPAARRRASRGARPPAAEPRLDQPSAAERRPDRSSAAEPRLEQPPAAERRPDRRVRPPRPVRAPPSETLKLQDPKTLEIDDPPTLRVSRGTPPASGDQGDPASDEQLTIPLEDSAEE